MKLLFFAAFDVAFTVRFNAQTGDVLDAEPLRQCVVEIGEPNRLEI